MRKRPVFIAAGAVCVIFFAAAMSRSQPAPTSAPVQNPLAERFRADVGPLLQRYCYECHGDGASAGDLELDALLARDNPLAARESWDKVVQYVRTQTMPSPDAELKLPLDQRDLLADAIERHVYQIDPANPDPGRVAIRRLNRVEYRNIMRDLTGVTFDPSLDLPQDDTGYGFDNIADVLTLPPMLMEKYLAAAEKVLRQAIPPGEGKLTGPMQALFKKHPTPEAAPKLLAEFTRRAWRRPPRVDEVDRLMRLYTLARKHDEDHRGGIRHTLTAVLVSPRFLFHGEVAPPRGGRRDKYPIDEFELASRLSFFLWSTMPDDQLLDLAARGELRRNLPAQVKRMLESDRSRALVENFAGQWLQFRNLDAVHPDRRTFEAYDDRLRDAMQTETRMFFESIVREDRSLMDVLTADYTFVNEKLAAHYGIEGVKGKEFRRVSLTGTPRRGVLTHGSVLTLTSNPTRTSPVKRGKWVLENLLGVAPPPPPAELPALEETPRTKQAATLRQQFELHRADPTCASCHAPMDPIGFALENFDAIGGFRTKDAGAPIDASAEMVDGTRFSGAGELVKILADTRRNDFYRAAAQAGLTYALGRGIEPTDRPAVDAIVNELNGTGGKFSSLVMGIVDSVPFQMRRAEPDQQSASADGGVQ